MEKEGLKCVLQFLQQSNLEIDILVTDRHAQINKWLRKIHPPIIHYFDVWHIAKGTKTEWCGKYFHSFVHIHRRLLQRKRVVN